MTFAYCDKHQRYEYPCNDCSLENMEESIDKDFSAYLEGAVDESFTDRAYREAKRRTDGSIKEMDIFLTGAKWARMLYKIEESNL
jgi:hypothetical protein